MHKRDVRVLQDKSNKAASGITLVALVVTIIVLLILAGVSLYLISGSNGVISKATVAAKKTEIARFIDSKELSDGMVYTDMLTKDSGYSNLYEYIKDKCEENNEATGDRLFRGDNGTYWIDDDNHLHFKDDTTGNDGTVVKGPSGELILKEVVTSDGAVNDVTTEDSLRQEIETVIQDLKKDYEKNKGEGESFQDYIDRKIEENGGSLKNPDTGGTIKPNGDGTYTYEDLTTPPNTGKIVVDGNGNTTITDIKINKPNDDGTGGNSHTEKTEEDLKNELNQVIEELKKEQEKEGNTDTFEDYLDKKIDENGGKLPIPSTGGNISQNDDGSFRYEDKEVPSNKVDFTIDSDGNPVIKGTEINKPDDNKPNKTDEDLRKELEKAIGEQKDKQKEEGDTGSFRDYLDNKIDENGGKLPTPITGGSISKNDDGTYTYEDNQVPPNQVIFSMDEDGNITIIEIKRPSETEKPNINLTVGDITFEYTTTDWTNQDVTVTAKPTRSIEGYTIETSRNGIVWNKTDTQTFKVNGTILVRLTNGRQYGAMATANVTNIDKTKPIVTNLSSTTYSIDMKATDEASGIVGYAVTEDNNEPTSFESCASTKSLKTTVTGRKQGQTYYVWVKDEAGNVSENKEITMGNVTELRKGDMTITYTTEDWTNQDITVTVNPEIDITGYVIQISSDNGKTWQDATSHTFAENGVIIIALRDAEGQLGKTAVTANVNCIDKTAPQIGTVSVTTNSFTFSATDNMSGLAGYAITETDTEPTSFTPIEGTPLTFSTTISNQKNNKNYYIWVKDKAGTVSPSKKVTLNPVTMPTASNLTATTSSWNGTNATVTFNTTTDFRIQYCTTQSTNDDDWHEGNSVTVGTGTTVYARLWDGTNGSSNYISHKPVLTYTITYNGNGATGGSTATSTHEYGTAKALTANGFSRTGYTFAGWNTAANGSGTNYSNSQSVTSLVSQNGGNLNLYAKWTANTNTAYKVIHQQMNVNGSGWTTVETENRTGTTDTNVTPARRSYTGFTSPAAQTKSIAPNGTMTITYQYTRNKYRFTLGSHAGVTTTGSSGTGDYYYGATITLKGTLKTGYTGNISWASSNTGLVGNKTTSNGATTTFGMPAGAVSMTPSATLQTYTVSYNANGGSGAPGNQTKTYGQNLTLSSTKPTRSGYTFQGWATSASGSVAYAAGATYTGNAALSLFAVWKQDIPPATSAITTSTYGGTANYSANGVTSWEIFYNDGTYIYLISTNIVPSSGLDLASSVCTNGNYVYVPSNKSSSLVNWMTNTSNWTAYASGFSGAVAYGGPTQDMLYKSYNAKNGTSYSAGSRATLSGHPWVAGNYYWLASTYSFGSAWFVYSFGNVTDWSVYGNGSNSNTYAGVRPLVRLPAGVKAAQGSDGRWNFSL